MPHAEFNEHDPSVWTLVEERRNEWLSAAGRYVDGKTVFELGEPFARTLNQYREILHHNGSIDCIKYAQTFLDSAISIVDAGCSSGYALTGLRGIFPDANLIGMDIRFAPLFTLSRGETHMSVRNLFEIYNISFYQESYTNIHQLLPDGFDLLFSVGSFLDEAYPVETRMATLDRFYQGLRPRGVGQIFIWSDAYSWQIITDFLQNMNIKHTFYPGNRRLLEKNNFDPQIDVLGTLTLGPKSE